MAEVIRFFPRQTLKGAATYYSEIFDVSEYAEVEVHLVGWAGDPVDVKIYTSNDSAFTTAGWSGYAPVTVSGGVNEVQSYSECLRYVVAEVVLQANEEITLQIDGVGRRST